ncbi:autophagy- protein 2 [Steccherinum ochraceum]|uniref:Autophagy-related protein 2 n=1 Tax=Steccherinum ochraceum TaxID=92696 RepID=A0A4R0RC53_9APHY|nr:autophagy- protein 2 [Steccherinum ochraceum]
MQTTTQTLGHFVQPGQLDILQIDSQIGSGYVQIRDVELNNEAINALISGLPIQLHDGSIGKVTARIPWPNPLTSSVGLSIESLHLTFHLAATAAKASAPSYASLAESVASVADTFIHEELSAPEEAALRESFHTDLSTSTHLSADNVPGGLDPFVTETEETHHESEPPGVSIFATLLERLLSRFHFDASDIRITLVHPAHASFTLSVPEIRYGTNLDLPTSETHTSSLGEGSSSQTAVNARTLIISGFDVTTRCLQPQSMAIIESAVASPSSRTASMPQQSPPTVSPSIPASPSSDIDEDTQMLMSQSLASLPPRPFSPASSVSGSLYQSALDASSPRAMIETIYEDPEPVPAQRSHHEEDPPVAPEASPLPPVYPQEPRKLSLQTDGEELTDEKLLSLRAEPIVVRLYTPSTPRAMSPAAADTIPPRSTEEDSGRTNTDRPGRTVEPFKVEISLGTLACALKARHVRSLIDVASIWSSHAPPLPAPIVNKEISRGPSTLDSFEITVRMHAVVLLVSPSTSMSDDAGMTSFWDRPLSPPRLPHGYLRIHLDHFYTFVTIADVDHRGMPAARSSSSERRTTCSLTLSDLSMFAFASPSPSSSTDLAAEPILITDPNLLEQYSRDHVHPDLTIADPETCMPTFDVVDWTHRSHQPQSTRITHWRSRVPPGRSHVQTQSPVLSRSPGKGSPRSPRSLGGKQGQMQRVEHPAVKVKMTIVNPKPNSSSRSRRHLPEGSVTVDCDIAPLHVFVAIDSILERRGRSPSPTLQFVEALTVQHVSTTPDTSTRDEYLDDSEEEDEDATPPGSPRANDLFKRTHNRDHERERRRLEQLVLEDLDLDFDYRQAVPERRSSDTTHQPRVRRKRKPKTGPTLKVTINIPMIRIQVRVPPPPSSASRSGAVVVDLHGLKICPGEPVVEKRKPTRFVEPADMPPAGPSSGSDSAGHILVTSSLQRIIIAYCPTGTTSAATLISVGTLPMEDTRKADATKGLGFEDDFPPEEPALGVLRIVASKSDPTPRRMPTSSSFVTTAVALEIPSVFVHVSKPQLDGLQLWADDLTQALERGFSDAPVYDDGDDDATERRSSKDPSLIGSRFFAKMQKSRAGPDGSSTVSAEAAGETSETIVKVSITKVALRVVLPRDEFSEVRPFDVVATDVDLLLELKPEGKDETVLTLGMMDASIFDYSDVGKRVCYLALTIPRELHPSSRPLLKLRFTSLIVPGTIAKETKVKVTLCGLTYNFHPGIAWITDLTNFVKAPPGAFETVVPSERTHISVKITDTSIRAFGAQYSGSVVLYLGEADFGTTIVGNSPQTSLRLGVTSLALYLTDDVSTLSEVTSSSRTPANVGGVLWKREGYALLAELATFTLQFSRDASLTPPDVKVSIDQGELRLHLCADTATALTAFIQDIAAAFTPPVNPEAPPKKVERKVPTSVGAHMASSHLMASLDENAFARAPDLISAPDMIQDDLPTNLDYLDESFGAAAGLRELTDDDLDEFGFGDVGDRNDPDGLVSQYGGETVRILHPQGLQIVEHHFDTLPPDTDDDAPQSNGSTFKLKVRQLDATLFLYDGYDWARTRRIIEEERKNMRRRLAKIRQLVASGQTPDPSVEETNTLLFNSVYVGLEHNVDELEPDALLAAIDNELNEDQETASQSSWQSFIPPPTSPKSTASGGASKAASGHTARVKVSKRSRGPSIEFRFMQLSADIDNYRNDPELASRSLVTIRDVEILDHIKTSTWRKFLTSKTTDSKGNIRETDSNMVRVELRQVYPALGHETQEARLRMKILPLRLHVDQDALDFLKKFFSFKDPDALPSQPTDPADDTYFQQAEVFPVDLKLDYKPRRVDYRALRDGRTIELMNFFHFDGAEMTLRHITLTGITGWAKVFDLLNDLWTPDVKATQLVEVISGVAPIRSVVNVGSGVADLVLLPIAQYRKDGRVVRGLQKGTTAFVKSTATEAIKLGARLATGTQVILEQAETVLGGQFKDPVTAETMPPFTAAALEELEDADPDDLISRYADQPTNVSEGVQSAYQSLRRNLNSAAQTILAVPMEVYERSGNEGTVRAVVRAVPIAVLKPMIGASEAISKTLLGLHNTLDPGVRMENEAKYKQR